MEGASQDKEVCKSIAARNSEVMTVDERERSLIDVKVYDCLINLLEAEQASGAKNHVDELVGLELDKLSAGGIRGNEKGAVCIFASFYNFLLIKAAAVLLQDLPIDLVFRRVTCLRTFLGASGKRVPDLL